MARGRPSMSDDVVKFSFSLPRELRDRFMERMRADDLPASSLLRHAIEEYLKTPRPVFFGAATPVVPAPRPVPTAPPAPAAAPMWAPESSAPPQEGGRNFEGIMALLEMANVPDTEQDAKKHD